jgi:hypothetical protein
MSLRTLTDYENRPAALFDVMLSECEASAFSSKASRFFGVASE